MSDINFVDNKEVHMFSTKDGDVHETHRVKRWIKTARNFSIDPVPYCVPYYNQGMGAIDLCDSISARVKRKMKTGRCRDHV